MGPKQLQGYIDALKATGKYTDVVLGDPIGTVLEEGGVLPGGKMLIQDWDGDDGKAANKMSNTGGVIVYDYWRDELPFR